MKNSVIVVAITSVLVLLVQLVPEITQKKAPDRPPILPDRYKEKVDEPDKSDSISMLADRMADLIVQQERIMVALEDTQRRLLALEQQGPTPTELESVKADTNDQETSLVRDHQDFFYELEDEMLYEEADSHWATQMRVAIDEIDARLSETNVFSSQISDRECRAATCRLEITHNEGTANLHLLPAFIASANSNQLYLKHLNEEGVDKTIAIFKNAAH